MGKTKVSVPKNSIKMEALVLHQRATMTVELRTRRFAKMKNM
jgi:hypothetical protein